MATWGRVATTTAQVEQNAASQRAADSRKPIIEDTFLRDQQLTDKSKRRKRKPFPTILGDAMAQAASTVQTLLGA